MISTNQPTAILAAPDCLHRGPMSRDETSVLASGSCRINILGFAGSGAALLALSVAEALDTTVLDTDVFSWRPTQPPFQIKRSRDARRDRLLDEIAQHPRVVVCGSVVGWGRPLESAFDAVIALVPSRKISGQRPKRGGGTSLRPDGCGLWRHDHWLSERTCPVLRLHAELSIAERVTQAIAFVRHACHRGLSAFPSSPPIDSATPKSFIRYPCSGHAKVGGVVFFARMLDKIRLHFAGELPADYNLGNGLDIRMCQFLNIDYAAVATQARREKDDAVVLEWCFAQGRRPSESDILYFNAYMTKSGWRDDCAQKLEISKTKRGWSDRIDLQTSFDLQDAEEGRK